MLKCPGNGVTWRKHHSPALASPSITKGILFNKLFGGTSKTSQGMSFSNHWQPVNFHPEQRLWGKSRLPSSFWHLWVRDSGTITWARELPGLPSAHDPLHPPPRLFPDGQIFKECQFKGAPNYFPRELIKEKENFKNRQTVDRDMV